MKCQTVYSRCYLLACLLVKIFSSEKQKLIDKWYINYIDFFQAKWFKNFCVKLIIFWNDEFNLQVDYLGLN